MSKSSKEYRLERDAALAQAGFQEIEQLAKILKGDLSPQRIELLKKQALDATNSVIFKAVDALVKQGRLVGLELSDTCKLEFRV